MILSTSTLINNTNKKTSHEKMDPTIPTEIVFCAKNKHELIEKPILSKDDQSKSLNVYV